MSFKLAPLTQFDLDLISGNLKFVSRLNIFNSFVTFMIIIHNKHFIKVHAMNLGGQLYIRPFIIIQDYQLWCNLNTHMEEALELSSKS